MFSDGELKRFLVLDRVGYRDVRRANSRSVCPIQGLRQHEASRDTAGDSRQDRMKSDRAFEQAASALLLWAIVSTLTGRRALPKEASRPSISYVVASSS